MSEAPRFRTVKTLAEVPGAHERGAAELLRLLQVRHGVQFVIVDDEAQPSDGVAASNDRAHDDASGRHAA